MARTVLLAVLIAAGFLVVPAHADPPAPHEVVYTVSAESQVTADIYYRDTDPPTWADYSHNPYQFSPKVRVEVGPGTPWVLHATLVDPQRWAMVTASSGRAPGEPRFRCELKVDGAVVATADGPKGALCALRHW
ncbi:hypothetical protein A5649_13005 [Mycolicibacter heraklionensis]|uniref:Secreted protein n=1 Tax=Mycolicibacter heraklionensis TaxID=512402 RepID=A0AA91EXH4_9MYCO|nr:hypothetical protein [Mycolicibacter heraklionensis]OBK80340.1 hypothetical protein A5649_13005 [Mycolicibacter heraklionensis]